MFGADTPLVMDALEMLGVAVAVTAGAVFLIMRRRKGAQVEASASMTEPSQLEERVRVLERIATDRSIDLADEIEALRDPKDKPSRELEGQE